MVKFKPIVYNEGDFRAFKYVGSSDVIEGQFCAVASSDYNTFYVTPAQTHSVFPGGFATPTSLFSTKAYFPIFKEDPNVENIGATISQNDFVIGFTMNPGNEFEVHKTCLEGGATASFSAIGGYAVLASTGKITYSGGNNDTNIRIAVVTATFANWARFRVI